MSPIEVGCIVLACVFGGALLGMAIHAMLPEQHLNAESKDVIKLGMGLIATMSALVLALLTNSAKVPTTPRETNLPRPPPTSSWLIEYSRIMAQRRKKLATFSSFPRPA